MFFVLYTFLKKYFSYNYKKNIYIYILLIVIMSGSFVGFLLKRDYLGHPVTLNYKGLSDHPTLLGATLTIMIKVMVLVYLVQESIVLINMNDPKVQVYERPLYESEIEDDLGTMTFDDFHYNFGIYLYSMV